MQVYTHLGSATLGDFVYDDGAVELVQSWRNERALRVDARAGLLTFLSIRSVVMDELKGNGEPNSLLNETPTMSVDEPAATAVGAGMPVRMLRAALAGLAISGIGYAALASSPALSKSFTKLTGLSIVDQAAASRSCATSCGMAPENECGSKCDSMTPYAEVAAEMSCSGALCPSMTATLAEGDCCDATGSCCASGGQMAGTCSAGACPSEESANDVVEGEVAVGHSAVNPAVNEYLQAAQSPAEGE